MKTLKEIPLLYYPTEILLIDDDINYSKNIEMVMLNEEIPIQVFNDPKEAVNFINNKSFKKISEHLVNIEDEYLDKTIFNVDFSTLHQEIYNKDRFKNISVVIVDYGMPGLNGKEFFEKIEDVPLKKILLTGEADYEMAVALFNSGLIDKFFRKNDAELFEKLIKEIRELKLHFFQKMTHSSLDALQRKSLNTPFTDPIFINFFQELVKENEITEFYALDESGSYLLLDSEGNVSCLIVKSDEDMQVLYEIAEGENDLSKQILADLKSKRKLTFFLDQSEAVASVGSWILYDASHLNGKNQNYYYALLKKPSFLKLKTDIYTYQQFLKENN